MTRFGYTLMTEQSGPRELVEYAVAGERAGFDFEVMSDHYSPWLTEQGHAPYAWSVLGAVAHATERVGLMTYVTCPTMRYHPAVVAQKAATVAAARRRQVHASASAAARTSTSTSSVAGWPAIEARQEMLAEAIEIIRALHAGDLVDPPRRALRRSTPPASGTCPRTRCGSAVAVAGERAVERFAPLADHLIAVEPDADLVRDWNAVDGAPRVPDRARAIGQIPICWDPDEESARKRAHEQFRWFGGGWSVNADLPTTAGFAGATQYVRPDDVAESIPCGPDLDRIVEAVADFWEAGFTDVALVQVGDEGQDRFLDEAAEPLLEKLRSAAP